MWGEVKNAVSNLSISFHLHLHRFNLSHLLPYGAKVDTCPWVREQAGRGREKEGARTDWKHTARLWSLTDKRQKDKRSRLEWYKNIPFYAIYAIIKLYRRRILLENNVYIDIPGLLTAFADHCRHNIDFFSYSFTYALIY